MDKVEITADMKKTTGNHIFNAYAQEVYGYIALWAYSA